MAPMEVCGIMLKIHHEFERRGIKHEFLTFYEYTSAENSKDYENKKLRLYFRIVEKCRKNREKNHTLLVRLWQILEMFCVLGIFFKSLLFYDTYLLFFGIGLFYCTHYLRKIERLEFMIYRLFRKRVIMFYFGSDSRPPYCGKFEGGVERLYELTREMAKRVQMTEQYAMVVAYPTTAQFQHKPFIVYNRIFPIIESEEYVKEESKADKGKVVILHAPSAQKWKGTKEIRELIKRLQDEGEPIEYVEISGQPHDKVMDAIRNADIVFDQLYSDIPLATLATEASYNGIPVVVCSYYCAELYEKEFKFELPPVCFCKPEEAEEQIRKLVHNKELRKLIGEKERKYVQIHYMAKDVIERLFCLIDGNVPSEWYFDPLEASYGWGAVNSKNEVEKKVVALVDTYGFDALFLNPNSKLYKVYQKIYNNCKIVHSENV